MLFLALLMRLSFTKDLPPRASCKYGVEGGLLDDESWSEMYMYYQHPDILSDVSEESLECGDGKPVLGGSQAPSGVMNY